jgi:DNA-binding MarR family transcriptional regulator
MFLLEELPTREMLARYKQRFPAMDVTAVEAALRLLRRASRLERRLDAYFASHELSQLRFLILIVLDREGDGTSLRGSELAERLGVSRPVITRTLRSLEADGLVSITGDDGDARARIVRLAPRGRDKLDMLLPGYYDLIQAFMREGSEAVQPS